MSGKFEGIANDPEVASNPLRSKSDIQQAFRQIAEPAKKYYSKGCAYLQLGATAQNYPQQEAQFEGFSRMLWGLVPYLAGGGETDLLDIYLEGIRNGTNPEHEEYWGAAPSYNLRLVELPTFALALTLAPDKFWEPLSDKEKDNLHNWLRVFDTSEPYQNNWLFFRVLVYMGLENVGRAYDKNRLSETLAKLETFYKGDGWYSDGDTRMYDFYIAWAMHYYGLIYGKSTGETKYLERARLYAKDFMYWFSVEGDAVPIGRSLLYKFAQAAFWSAYVYAGGPQTTEEMGVAKGIILRNLRHWFKRPIFDRDGILSMGYGYPNIAMTEGYSSLGSPYWAMKSFLILALPDDHLFWTAEELPLPELAPLAVQKYPNMIISRREGGRNIVMLTSGQYAGDRVAGLEAKYGKFAYSNVFGFSVSRSWGNLILGAFDSMLALSDDGESYRVRKEALTYQVTEQAVYSTWKPWADVAIRTVLIPLGDYHIRVHRITTARSLITAEGGFSCDCREECGALQKLADDNAVCACYPQGNSCIMDLSGMRKADIQITDPNTNIIHPRTVLPTLYGDLPAGEHILVCGVFGTLEHGLCDKLWTERPTVTVTNDAIVIVYENVKTMVPLAAEE